MQAFTVVFDHLIPDQERRYSGLVALWGSGNILNQGTTSSSSVPDQVPTGGPRRNPSAAIVGTFICVMFIK